MSCKPEGNWPDWRGEAAVIVATGESSRRVQIGRGQRVIAIKSAWSGLSRVDVVYGSDARWWHERDGLPEYTGLKLTASPAAARLPGVRAVSLVKTEDILVGETGTIGCGSRNGGGHSGFHVLNLVVQFGAIDIVMVGMDMSNGHPDMNIHRAALARAIAKLATVGVTVSMGSP